MNGATVAAIVLLVLILVPIPLVWIITTIFPDGYTKSQAQRMHKFFIGEWKRILLCVVVIVMIFIFSPDNALQVTLIGAAILIGRAVAVSRNR